MTRGYLKFISHYHCSISYLLKVNEGESEILDSRPYLEETSLRVLSVVYPLRPNTIRQEVGSVLGCNFIAIRVVITSILLI